MSPITSLLLLASSLAQLSSGSPLPEPEPAAAAAAACASGVHILVARGSTEKAGEGAMGAVATRVKNQITGSDSVGVPYPATLNDYMNSEAQGVGNMTKLIRDYVTSCPSSKIVLMGYSQGAQVSLDTLCGTSEPDFNTTAPLASKYAKNIIAVVGFGDPTHVPGKSWDYGTSTFHGVFTRQGNGCDPYAGIIHSYCDRNDTFCDSGSSLQVHQSYFNTYGVSAANWVVSKYKGT